MSLTTGQHYKLYMRIKQIKITVLLEKGGTGRKVQNRPGYRLWKSLQVATLASKPKETQLQ